VGFAHFFIFMVHKMVYPAQTYREKMLELLEPVIESEGMELVELECQKGKNRWVVRIYIDKDGGVTIDDCAGISREVGDLLTVYDIPPGPYNLEVSSPGLDRPLVRDRDFVKYRGYDIKIRLGEELEGRRNFRGTLKDYIVDGGEKLLVLDVEGTQYRIPRDIVLKANLQYEL
jgi:ribosome maturation factor RimP